MAIFRNSHYTMFSDLLYNKTGIYISQSKKHLLESKLQKLIIRNQISSYDEYYKIISDNSNRNSIQEFIDNLTTNTTEFFRENAHYNYITQNIQTIMAKIPGIRTNKEIRIWCAACSAGQEPVTLAIVLSECLGNDIDIKILATEISSRMLRKAVAGFYSEKECKSIPRYYLTKFFYKADGGYCVSDEIRRKIVYRQFNLMNDYKFKNLFDIIFCRNVMIYFDSKAQKKLINRLYSNIVKGGMLFIGHSESLINIQHDLRYIGPSIYTKQ